MKLGSYELPPLWSWQQIEAKNLSVPKRAIFADPRMGKTNVVAAMLRANGQCGNWHRGLVTAPLKVCPTWMEVLAGAGIPVHNLYDKSGAKIERLFSGEWEGVAVVNRDKLIQAANALKGLDVFVADESHNYAGVSTDRARAYRRLAKTTPWVRVLTGTPVPRHYGSLWSQLSPLDPEHWPTSYEKFAQHFLIRDQMFKSRVISHINVEELQTMVLRVAGIYRRDDYFGPDNYQIVQRTVDMPDRAWRLYHKLAKEWVLDDPEFGDLSADGAAVRLLRLQQLTSGFLPNAETKEYVPVHQAKIDALCADLDEIIQSDEKFVVFHRFVPEGRAVFEEIARLFPHLPLFKIDGSHKRSADDDKAVMEAFNNADGAAGIIVQQQSGSEGISLREGRHLMYLSRTFSFTDDQQSRDRVYKSENGKALARTITHYDVDGTVDGFVSNLLADKRDLHTAIRNADRQSLVYGRIRKRARRIA